MQRFEIQLHLDMHRAAAQLARRRDITIGQLVRDLLAREISRATQARPPVRADERLIAPLRARLAADFAHALSWEDLQSRLNTKGYILQAAGGGLAVHSWPGNTRVCKASELGFSYSKLMRRLRTPFPGHSHDWLFDKITQEHISDAPEEAPDFDVIERFGS